MGSKPLSTRDWIFGSRPRRLLLERAIAGRSPRDGWNKTELAALAEVTPNGGVDEHVAGLVAVGLLDGQEGRWCVPAPRPPLAGAVARVVGLLGGFSDDPAPGRHLTSGERLVAVPDGSAVRRELRRARTAVADAMGLSDATRQRVLAALDQALHEVASDTSPSDA